LGVAPALLKRQGMKTFQLMLSASMLFSFTAVAGELRGRPDQGKAIFTANCQMCHGPEGKGDGPAAAGLNPKPANFSDPARVKEFSEPRQVRVVTNGGASEKLSPLMPSFSEALSEQQVRDVIAFIRANLIPKEVSQR
jgi:mono/diheme cytochrome c family protein